MIRSYPHSHCCLRGCVTFWCRTTIRNRFLSHSLLMDNALTECDVVVLGAGPAGSAISTVLAEKGWSVEVLEKARHPRFHIGESLLPHTIPFLKRLGVLHEIEKIGLKKHGAELISPQHAISQTLYFSQAMDKTYPYAFQVRRSEFDSVLVQNAATRGVTIHQDVAATQVNFDSEKFVTIAAVNEQQQKVSWQARFVVDATGRQTLLANQLQLKRKSRKHGSAAVFSHFEGVQRHTGLDEGNITICWFEHGWFWIIPFKDGITSVGAVCRPTYLKTRTGTPDEFLLNTIQQCSPMAERLRGAKMVMSTVATGNYSYSSTQMTGDRFVLLGDAYAFVDPVFSSGVHLALNSAMLGADLVDSVLRKSPDVQRVRRNFERKVQNGISTYSWFIHRFTQPAFRGLFMAPRGIFRIKEAILSVLAGDVFGKTPTRFPVFLFKGLYYVTSLLDF